MQRTLLFALSATLIGFTGCNKSSQEKASEKSAEVRKDADKAMQEVKENAQQAADKVEKDAKQAVGEIKENAADAREKIANEGSKAGDAVRNSADKDDKTVRNDSRDDAREAKNDAKAEARQTNRDVHEALGIDQGKTAADKKLNDRIRTALKRDKNAARDAGDVTLETRDGHVRLKGTVASEEAKKAIASEARKVAGLTHVTDDIKVAERVGQGSND